MEFTTFTSSIKPSFWTKYTELKLDIDKLNVNDRKIWGYYTNVKMLSKSIIEVDSTSFNNELNIPNTYLPFYGILMNKNTIEEFKDCNKTKIIQEIGNKLWEYIENGDAIKNPTLLNTFFILSYVDLKKYHYYYWFAFPSATISYELLSTDTIDAHFNSEELDMIMESYNNLDLLQKAFFVLTKDSTSLSTHTYEQYLQLKGLNVSNVYYVIPDSSTDKSPMWALRNYLLLVLQHFNHVFANSNAKGGVTKEIKVLSLRFARENYAHHCKESFIYQIRLPEINGNIKNVIHEIEGGSWIGWERNERSKLGPRMANLKNSMDPKCLMESAVDLNLKLMKWRLLPDINLDIIKGIKCLLLGSGTLGSSVARNLLGWGVRKITFVDNSTVSYSNPVRQCLFNYDDCIKKLPKSEAAAANLKQIFPGVDSVGYQLNIPMPGHPIGESILEETKESVHKLITLIEEHDVIFLLMDSRESRWLPTLLGAYMQKIVINAALGFDTFLVMRHGYHVNDPPIDDHCSKETDGLKAVPGYNLGCYFCNDITAPGDSLKDRTLDQQCTVTRPGVSNIASALAVELLVSILQHKKGINAPAYYRISSVKNDDDLPSESLLGILPHSIRGFLSTFTQVLPATRKYDQCTACSSAVIKMYEDDRFEFLLKTFNDSKYLEEITGLSKLHTEDIDVWELSSDDD